MSEHIITKMKRLWGLSRPAHGKADKTEPGKVKREGNVPLPDVQDTEIVEQTPEILTSAEDQRLIPAQSTAPKRRTEPEAGGGNPNSNQADDFGGDFDAAQAAASAPSDARRVLDETEVGAAGRNTTPSPANDGEAEADSTPAEAPRSVSKPSAAWSGAEGREAMAKAGMIEAQLRAESNSSDASMGELHELLDAILGHLGNHSRQFQMQQDALSDLRSQLENLEGSANNNRNGR
jgi:hypothetical protein